MPARYHIHTESAPPRVRPVGKLGIVDWREDCSSCHNCVKKACAYAFFRDEADRLREDVGFLDYVYQCKGCLSCVQDCTKGILTRVVNPEFERLGDDYYTPDMVLTTWYQAETGRIPVSGAGYGGPFSGPGFDSMWTDMSEIVRPTRDGIHGREYISTSVDVGRKRGHLTFDEGGALTGDVPPLLDVPIPVIFDAIPDRWSDGPVASAAISAATRLGSYAVVPAGRIPAGVSVERQNVIPWLQSPEDASNSGLAAASMVMIDDGPGVADTRAALKGRNADQIVAIRVGARPEATERLVELARDGAEVLHLVFDGRGRESENAPGDPRHVRDVIRDVHGALVRDGTRDEVTLIVSGGVVLAEHVVKAILCGTDLVAIDAPLPVAAECRLCAECDRGEACPVAMPETDPAYAMRRICNLIGAWHLQLVEMLGAMGIREIRRSRGETGRCMFREDLERDTFGELFGERIEDAC